MSKKNKTEYIKKLSKKFTEIGDKDKTKIRILSHRDWGVVISLFFIIVVLVIAVHIYLFIQIGEGIFSVKQQGEDSSKKLDIEKLERTTASFDEQEKEFNRILGEKPNISDPSI